MKETIETNKVSNILPAMPTQKIPALLPIVLLCLATQWAYALEWNSWRGPDRDARVPVEQAWPENLSALTLQWSQSKGKSYAGPLMLDAGVLDLASTSKLEHCMLYDKETGAVLWKRSWQGSMSVPFFAASGGNWVRATPVASGDLVIVPGMRDTLHCLRLSDGSVQWSKDFPQQDGTPLPSFGQVTSPLIVDDVVITQAAGAVLALSVKDGSERWRRKTEGGGMRGSSFSSPVLANWAGKSQLIVQSRARLLGCELATGKILWQRAIPAFRGMNILTPVLDGMNIFTSSYGGGSRLLQVNDKQDAVSQRWENKLEAYMSSPILHNGYVYFLRRDRHACCLRLQDGKQVWVSNERFGKYWSMVARGDQVLILDSRGIVMLASMSDRGLQISERKVVSKEESWAHLALSGQQVAVRGLTTLSVYSF